jgi:uncharacterized protein with ParB-like and HNH nuclease domain
MKKLLFGSITFLSLLIGGLVFGQTSNPGSLKREEVKKQIEQIRKDYRERIQEKRLEMKTKIEELKGQLKEELKGKISEKNQKIVEKIYERINALNERMTNHYLDVLDHLEKVLKRIESRTQKAKLNGRDVSSVETAIEKASQAINNAREEVKIQAEKVYQPPQITTEANLKLDVGKLRKQLHDDLKTVEKLVRDARDAVRQAAVALAQIPKVDELEVSTTTGTTTETTTQTTQ